MSTIMMAKTQKDKANAHHLGLLKAKLAKLRRELLATPTNGGGGAGEGFDVTKSGDSRVGLVEYPSVGKSTLLNKLTGTFSEVCYDRKVFFDPTLGKRGGLGDGIEYWSGYFQSLRLTEMGLSLNIEH